MENQAVLINVDFGITQLSGNFELFARLLGRFVEEYQDSNRKLSEFYQHNNYEGLQLLIHTIKGVSGNLGLERLAAVSKHVEQQAKRRDIQEQDFTLLLETITETIAAIPNVKDPSQQETPAAAAPQTQVDSGNADTNQLGQLITALEHHRFISDELFTQATASSNLSEQQKHEIKQAINDLDYELALNLTKQQ